MKNREFRELQVSSTQLAVIFLGILVIGVVIFLLGVSVGKKHAQVAEKATLAAQKEPEQVRDKLVIPETPSTSAPLKKEEPEAKTEAPVLKPEVAVPAKETTAQRPKLESDKASPAAKKTPPKSEAKPSEPVAAPRKSLYYVQVGAVAERRDALSISTRYKTMGYPVVILEPLSTDKKPFFRVRLGGFATRAEAEAAQARLAGSGGRKVESFIVRD